ncbi:MAG: hypothetical protein O3B03_06620 [Proteobacteria bacterium]|nr:hypothetical protein [Pseudomonadota bacterium]MDA1331047.1 hypothetical protein [Pseudomonadota bacterium]
MEEKLRETATTSSWACKNPTQSSALLVLVGILAMWMISNIRAPETFNAVFTFLVVIPILGLLPAVSLVASLLSASLLKERIPNKNLWLVRGLSIVALSLNVLAIIFFIKTIPIFFE